MGLKRIMFRNILCFPFLGFKRIMIIGFKRIIFIGISFSRFFRGHPRQCLVAAMLSSQTRDQATAAAMGAAGLRFRTCNGSVESVIHIYIYMCIFYIYIYMYRCLSV